MPTNNGDSIYPLEYILTADILLKSLVPVVDVTLPLNLPFKLPVIEILPLPENTPENPFTE